MSLQDQELTRIQSRPGIVKEQTPLAASNNWTDADKVRFRYGKPELMGGWQNVTIPAKTADLKGTPRALEVVRTLDDTRAAVIATNIGLFSTELSQYHNITPVVTSQVTASIFNTTAGETRVIVSLPSHGFADQSLVGLVSVSATIGGNLLLNTDVSTERYFVVSVISDNAFAIDVSATAAATSAAAGQACTLIRYLNAGTTSNTIVGGYGTGVYSGDFDYGTSPDGTTIQRLRMWSLDLWGTDVVAVPRGGQLYIWRPSTDGITANATLVTAAPSINNIVKVASEERHILLYGTHDIAGNYDPLLIRWCSQEDYTDWTPSQTNTAGEVRLNSRGSEIISVTKMADKAVILTDCDLFVQSYIGPSDVFGFVRAGEQCGAISQNAAVEYNGVLYWMSNVGQFYRYDGRLQALPCTVLRYVFDNISLSQKEKIICGTNAQFDEIIWFYPTEDSPDAEPDRYVIFNPVEGHWTIGSLSRTTWMDRSVFNYPLATGGTDEGLFYHEIGYTADGTPMDAYIDSSYFIRDDGDKILFCNKFMPDFSNIVDGGVLEGTIDITLFARKYANGPTISKGPFTVTGSTQKISTRLRGREFAYRFSSRTIGNTPWRQGDFFMALEEDGKR